MSLTDSSLFLTVTVGPLTQQAALAARVPAALGVPGRRRPPGQPLALRLRSSVDADHGRHLHLQTRPVPPRGSKVKSVLPVNSEIKLSLLEDLI